MFTNQPSQHHGRPRVVQDKGRDKDNDKDLPSYPTHLSTFLSTYLPTRHCKHGYISSGLLNKHQWVVKVIQNFENVTI